MGLRFRVTVTVRESTPICIARECTYLLVLISVVAILGKKLPVIDTDTFIYSVLRPGAPDRLEAGSITDGCIQVSNEVESLTAQ